MRLLARPDLGVCILLLASLALAQTEPLTPQHIQISFAGRLAGKAFACSSNYEGVGVKKATVTPQDLRFFISNVELLDASGAAVSVSLDQDGIWQYKNVALVDLEDGTGACRNGNAPIHQFISGSVPAGQYAGIRFVVGVPFELDHIDPITAPSPLNMTAMEWNWQVGYKFIRAEVVVPSTPHDTAKQAAAVPPQSSGTSNVKDPKAAMRSSGFPVHIGSTGCGNGSDTAAPERECKHPNRILVTLQKFDFEKDLVIFDFGKLLSESDVSTNAANTPPGCMSLEGDADCLSIMKALGLPYGDSPAGEQSVFYAEPK